MNYEKVALLKGPREIENKLSLSGKVVLRKKKSAILYSVWLSQTYTKSFGGKNLALYRVFPITSLSMCLISG